jgi:hypothetical protein
MAGNVATVESGMPSSVRVYRLETDRPCLRASQAVVQHLVWEHACPRSVVGHRNVALERTLNLLCALRLGAPISGHVEAAIADCGPFAIVRVVDGDAACTTASIVTGQCLIPAPCCKELQVSRAVI